MIISLIKRFTNPYFRIMGLYKERNETVKLPRVFNLLGPRINQGKKQSRTHGTIEECIFLLFLYFFNPELRSNRKNI